METEFILMRHSIPDYSLSEQMVIDNLYVKYTLAPLSQKGVENARKIAFSDDLLDIDVIISSPYTRAFQTANIIYENHDCNFLIEPCFHEWSVNFACKFINDSEFRLRLKEVRRQFFNNEKIDYLNYESLNSVKLRMLNAMKKYLQYKKVLIVSHSVSLYSVTNQKIDFCGYVTGFLNNNDFQILKKVGYKS